MVKAKILKAIKVLQIVAMAVIIHNYAIAQSFPNAVQNNLSIEAGVESRKTDFRWSIAGNTNGENPNILSELIFNPVHSAGFYVATAYQPYRKFKVAAHFSSLKTYKGSATDIDYDGDNRTNYQPPSSGDTLFNSNKGNMLQYNLSISYLLVENNTLELSAGAGYHFSKELFFLQDEEMPDLNTSYQAKWQSARIFVNGTLKFSPRWYFSPEVSFQPGAYRAAANWNIKEEFQQPVSFVHEANSNGWSYRAGLGYRLSRHLGISAGWLYSNWKTKEGIDRLFLKNGETPETQFNGAFKKSSGWRLNAIYNF